MPGQWSVSITENQSEGYKVNCIKKIANKNMKRTLLDCLENDFKQNKYSNF